jgi:hypothetical protein
MNGEFWTMISAYGQWAGVIFSFAGYVLIWLQLRATRKAVAADLILRIEGDFMDRHTATYERFQRGGQFTNESAGPKNVVEISDIEHYLDFFSTLQLLRHKNLITLKEIDKMFAFRFFFVLNNKHTLQVVKNKSPYWDLLYKLYADWVRLRKATGDEIPLPEYEAQWLHGTRKRTGL